MRSDSRWYVIPGFQAELGLPAIEVDSSNVSIDLTSNSVSSNVGTLLVQADSSFSINGINSTISIGSLSISSAALVPINSISVTTNIPNISVSAYSSVVVPGSFASTSIGTISANAGSSINTNVVGIFSTSNIGALSLAGNSYIEIVGIQASSHIQDLVTGSVTNIEIGLEGVTLSANLTQTINSASSLQLLDALGIQSSISQPILVGSSYLVLNSSYADTYIGNITAYSGEGQSVEIVLTPLSMRVYQGLSLGKVRKQKSSFGYHYLFSKLSNGLIVNIKDQNE
jgi:hypothetical protein